MKKFTNLFVALIAVIMLQAQTKNDPQKLTVSNSYNFGSGVAVSGDYLIVGAKRGDYYYHGKVYFFHSNGTDWSLYQTLDPSPGGGLGYAVDIDGDWAIAGAPSENGVASGDGVVYVYHNDNGTWNLKTKLHSLDTANSIKFGGTLAISGDYIIVGTKDDYGSGKTQAAYIYHYDGSNWTPYQKITPAVYNGAFGKSVDINGDYAVIGGGSGQAYVFHLDAGVWTEDGILVPVSGNAGWYAYTVGIVNGMAFVGSPTESTNGSSAGGVYIFEKGASGWVEKNLLLASDGSAGDRFGWSLSAFNDYLLVGAKDNDVMGSGAGAAYLYHYDGNDWIEKTKIYDISKSDEQFGRAVGLCNNHFIVGAPNNSGSATVFPIDYTLSNTYVWTGAAGNGDWNDPANWNPTGVPGINDDASIPQNTDTVICTSGNAAVRNLEIQYGGAFVLSGGALTIAQDLNVSGVFYMFVDPATNISPSLIVNGNFLGAGAFYFNYYIPENDADWHAISTPVEVNTNSGFINDFYLNIWDETQNSFVHIEPVDCTLPYFSFEQGLGAFIKLVPDYASTSNCAVQNPPTIDYSTGEPQYIEIHEQTHLVHNSDFAYPLTFTSGGSYEGWNLTGNPYTATIDITALVWDAGVDQSVQIWDGSNYISGTASGVGNYLLAPGQGFFVHTNNNAGFNFSTSALTTATAPVYKNDNALLKLRASSSLYEDVAYICIDENATEGFDTKYDAPKKFTPVEGVPQLYTVSSNGKKLSINSVSQPDETMPVFFRAGVNGEFNIEAVEVQDFSTVILEDLLTGTKTNLLKDSYTFYYSTGQTDARFLLHFTPLGLEQNSLKGINVFSNGKSVIVNNENEKALTVTIYDLMGREVAKEQVHRGRNELPVRGIGLFIVNVVSEYGIMNRKVLIK